MPKLFTQNRLKLFILLCCFFTNATHSSESPYPTIEVVEPYLEIHTGPDWGYPIFHVAKQHDHIEIIKRRTDWFKVRTHKGKTGWVSQEKMEDQTSFYYWSGNRWLPQPKMASRPPEGQETTFQWINRRDFLARRWEAGLLGGSFDGASVMNIYGNYSFTSNISSELALSQILGTFSSSVMLNANLLNQPFPHWRFSPFFTLGAGGIQTNPRATLIQSKNRNSALAHYGVGIRTYITRRFIFRAEYKNYVIFSSDTDNEDIDEWKAGFAFFF